MVRAAAIWAWPVPSRPIRPHPEVAYVNVIEVER